jgi:hypothetical protein
MIMFQKDVGDVLGSGNHHDPMALPLKMPDDVLK